MRKTSLQFLGTGLLCVVLVFGTQTARAQSALTLPHEPDRGPWEPRRVALIPPEGLRAGSPLIGQDIIASDYSMGADFIAQRGQYESNDEEAELYDPWLYETDQDGKTWRVWRAETDMAAISNAVVCEGTIAYLVGETRYASDDEYSLDLLCGCGGIENVYLDPPTREREPFVGPMLCTDEGVLLFADTAGKLNTVEGGHSTQVSDVTVQAFVWHDGFIYFTNMQDQVTYKDVYCEEYGEHLDIAYPRLYRMRLDGSELTKLTDCGVKGLVSQGRYIVYQNLDDPFVPPIAEMPEPWEWLSGGLWCLSADTGEHRPMNIMAETYIATPAGLAVLYNRFKGGENDERDIAQTVLFDYVGKTLYPLDIPADCLYAPYCVTDTAIVYGVADAYISVPLDGNTRRKIEF